MAGYIKKTEKYACWKNVTRRHKIKTLFLDCVPPTLVEDIKEPLLPRLSR